MQCEICGQKIIGRPNRIIIEGAKMFVCSGCARFSSSKWYPEQTKPSSGSLHSKVSIRPLESSKVRRTPPNLGSDLELIDGFSTIIREAREHLGLDHAALGRKIGEKVSVLQKVELGKLNPDTALARKLEHELRINILSPPQEIEYLQDPSLQPQKLTFGDIVSIKKKDQRSEQ